MKLPHVLTLALTLLHPIATAAQEKNTASPPPPPSTEELRELFVAGQFRTILATTEAAKKTATDSDDERRFLDDLAGDFAVVTRAETGGATTLPVGKRLRSINGKHFALHPQPTDSYDQAADIAESFGGRLAEPRTLEESQLLFEELILPAQRNSTAIKIAKGWLGIVNAEPGDTDTWTYRSSGRPITFTQWKQGEPDGNDGEGMAAILFSDQGGKWLDGTPDAGSDTQPKFALIEWTHVPFAADAPRDAAFDLTAPLHKLSNAPAFQDLSQRAADAIRREAVAPAEARFAQALAAYRKAVSAAESAATASGELDAVVAVRKEKRLADQITHLGAIGSLAAREAPAGDLSHPRAAFLENITSILDQRAENARPLLASYRKALAAIESDLTREYRIADAISIRGLRNDLAALLGEKRQSTGKPKPATAAKTDPRLLTLDQLQLDIPDRPWPRKAYDPGTPGSLKGFGYHYPQDTKIDLSRAEGIDDFVKVAGNHDGWIALRANGTLVSNRNELHGKTGVWRMIPTHEAGAFLFWNDNTVTFNNGRPLEYEGQPIDARQVNWINGGGGVILITMKDGSARCISQNLDAAERAQLEKMFTGAKRHEGYRYGVYGIDSQGQALIAVSAEKPRMEKEKATRFPGVDNESYRRHKIVDLFSSTGGSFFLTDDAELLRADGSWFPKKPVRLVVPGDGLLEKRARSEVLHVWHSDVIVTLGKRGDWHVAGRFAHDENAMREFVTDMLKRRKTPIRDMRLFTTTNAVSGQDNPRWCSYAFWIE